MRALLLLPLLVGILACAESKPATHPGPIDLGAVDAGTPLPDAAPLDSGESPEDAGPSLDATAPDAEACPRLGPEVVQFATEDGVQLEADLYTAGAPNRPLVVLLHMIPPSNTRRNYPAAFIDALWAAPASAQQLNVINLDRRGAGGSGGVARDAYTGPKGALDVKAALDFFRSHSCGAGLSSVALVGASNGSTSVLDYTVRTESDATLLVPQMLVFLTGGSYTEMQNRIATHRATLEAIPIRFVFSTAERAWSAPFLVGAPAGWVGLEYGNGDHGTRMFTAAPESVDAVASALLDRLNP